MAELLEYTTVTPAPCWQGIPAPVVAVTGATGTLGKAVGFEFVRHGWHVEGCARRAYKPNVDDLFRFALSGVNVTDEAQVADWFASLPTPPRALVTCAGISDVAEIEDQEPEAWRAVLDANLTGTWLCAREAVKAGVERVVTVGSVHGCTPTSYPFRAAYTASKGGVAALTVALAVELAPRGVSVNCVAPGHLPVLMSGTASGRELLDAAAARTPLGRLVEPDEVAQVAYWLGADAPRALVGQVIVVDGGFSMSTWPMEE